MPENLFAVCRLNGDLVARRVYLDHDVQEEVETLFSDQEEWFRAAFAHEIAFNGNWNPDNDEVLTIEAPDEANILGQTLAQNALAVETIDPQNFMNEGIKALFTGSPANGDEVLLVQKFTAGQVLNSKMAYFFEGNAFRRLESPTFSLASGLTCIIEDGLIKFKSFSNLRSIFNVAHIYREATDAEVEQFATHEAFNVAEVAEFVDSADQQTRRLITAISNSGVLDHCTAVEIRDAALGTGLNVDVDDDGQIIMPAEKRQVKEFLRFLDESRYSGPLTGTHYITNSRRHAPPQG